MPQHKRVKRFSFVDSIPAPERGVLRSRVTNPALRQNTRGQGEPFGSPCPLGAENGFPTQAYSSFTISALRKAFSSKVTPAMRSSCTRLHPNAFDKDKKSSGQIQTQNPILRRDRSGCPSISERQYSSSCSNEGSAPCRIISTVRLRAMFSICPPLKSYLLANVAAVRSSSVGIIDRQIRLFTSAEGFSNSIL